MLIMIDLDNTLADRSNAVRTWVAHFAAEHDLSSSDALWITELDNDGYSSRVDVFTAIKARFELRTPVSDLLWAYQSDIVELVEPVAGAHRCLDDMRARGWQIAIVTNGSTKQQNAKIDHLGFRSMVDAVVVSETLGIKKPESGIFEHAVSLLGFDLVGRRRPCWMVGDSARHDIEGAQALGLSTAWMPRGRPWPTDQPGPTVVVSDLVSLPAQLVAAS